MAEKKTVEIEKHEMIRFGELENDIVLLKERFFDLSIKMDQAKDKIRQLTIQKIQHIEKMKEKYKLESQDLRLDYEKNHIIEE
jgi:hypothetical protein